MGKRARHQKKRCRVADRKPQPKVVAQEAEYAPRRSKPKYPEHALIAAFEAGRIDEEQFKAGDRLRTLCESVARSSKDSTNLERTSGGANGISFAVAQQLAGREIAKIKERLGGARAPNWIICEAFCGYGHSMVDALRMANIPFRPQSVLPRVQEALNALCGRKRTKVVAKPRTVPKQPKVWEQRVCAGCRIAETKRGPVIVPCRAPLSEKSCPSTIGYWQRKPLKLCGSCSKTELEFITLLGDLDLHARYRANLWLPAPDEPEAAEPVARQKVAA